MTEYILQRLGQALLIAILISLTTFLLLFVAKDPARALAAPDASPADIQLLRERYGLDRPVPEQYLRWAARAVRGDFGNSLYSQQPVSRLLAPRVVATFQLAGVSILLTVLMAVPLGVLAAVGAARRDLRLRARRGGSGHAYLLVRTYAHHPLRNSGGCQLAVKYGVTWSCPVHTGCRCRRSPCASRAPPCWTHARLRTHCHR